jgi:hypothetical protein
LIVAKRGVVVGLEVFAVGAETVQPKNVVDAVEVIMK